MPCKKELLASIKPDMTIDESFYKSVYADAYTDPEFIPLVANKLMVAGHKEAIQGYNEWFAKYCKERDEVLHDVAKWYVKWSNEKVQKEIVKKEIVQEITVKKVTDITRKGGDEVRKQQPPKRIQQWNTLEKLLNFHTP